MPTSAKTPDQRSDRYLGTSKWVPRLRHICRVGCTPAGHHSEASAAFDERPQSVRLRIRLLIGDVHQLFAVWSVGAWACRSSRREVLPALPIPKTSTRPRRTLHTGAGRIFLVGPALEDGLCRPSPAELRQRRQRGGPCPSKRPGWQPAPVLVACGAAVMRCRTAVPVRGTWRRNWRWPGRRRPDMAAAVGAPRWGPDSA